MEFTAATGRRKEATARVRLRKGNGNITVNKRKFEEFFTTEPIRKFILQPLQAINGLDGYDIDVTVKGGGPKGQAGAMRHGIARALENNDPTLREVLKENGMLTRDSRVKERKKTGQPGARKRFQFSKR
ncbi:MAG: 30S ribosomal protein S9 [Lentisphaeria bacterium]|nr:30S ribosomal protein S9 [Lentisphaeria bacterium]NQZ69422.1 30S ribosomal protein S9 [Lentisphaeria bacterium]